MRSRVNERLTRAARFPVTLIVAPAGFGKTVALRDFISTSRLDAVRYDVAREDATLLAFAHGLARALEPVAPSAASSFASMQSRIARDDSPVADLADWFTEHLRRVVATVVIDDLHHAAVDPRVVDLVVTLIERTTGRISWIIATRSDAGLPVASWLGYGRIDVPIGEDDLRFTEDEALAAAQDAHSNVPSDEVDALRDLTGGWPVALSIALRTRTHATDLRAATAGAREMLYRYLAEQVYNGLGAEQQMFLLDTSVFPTFDASTVEALGGSTAFLHELRRGATFISETAPGTFRYHDLFRDFLESELRRSGRERWVGAHERGAAILEKQGDAARALALYTATQNRQSVQRLLAERGADLYEHGEAETISSALAVLDGAEIAEARVLALKATVLAGRGHVDLAQRDFLDAIALASDPEVRLGIVHRYAIELIRHDRDAIALLAPYAVDETIPPARRVPLLGTYATALARAGLLEEAVQIVATAIASINRDVSDTIRARFYQQAAFVHQLLPDRGNAWNYANLAIELASAQGLFDVVARAYSILYTIVYDDEDDPIESLALLDRLIEASRKSGSVQTRMYGVLASMDIEVDRGDDIAIERLDGEIARLEGNVPRISASTLLPARALRAAWSGDFESASRILAGTADQVSGADRRALRNAEIALYAISAGDAQTGTTAIARAQEALAECKRATRRTARTLIVLALAELLQGHTSATHRLLVDAESAVPRSARRLQTFLHAARVFYRRQLGQSEPADIAAALERLRSAHFGGIARLLSALPFPAGGEGGGYSQLTPAERDILALLAQGATSKDIAGRTGRSAQTIDTHIRSICRKLECSGRREAVALAIRSGWVHS
ncbi:MAG: helix-turn-helix domain-containing protein [Candidatus Eremiobacteraeota bacterium]|nr:helix-turn-helix domain-containing protein [Candidatus Eremiobacteraeota bacterium]